MNEIMDVSGNPRVEISGWTSDNECFVEKAEIVETDNGEQRLFLQHKLPDGALVFVRWPLTEDASAPAPHAYRIENLRHLETVGWEVRLQAVTRRTSRGLSVRPKLVPNKGLSGPVESEDNLHASNGLEDIFP